MVIETQRLILREMTEDDFDALYRVLADSDITIKSKELNRDCKGILCGKCKIYKEKEVVQQ